MISTLLSDVAAVYRNDIIIDICVLVAIIVVGILGCCVILERLKNPREREAVTIVVVMGLFLVVCILVAKVVLLVQLDNEIPTAVTQGVVQKLLQNRF